MPNKKMLLLNFLAIGYISCIIYKNTFEGISLSINPLGLNHIDLFSQLKMLSKTKRWVGVTVWERSWRSDAVMLALTAFCFIPFYHLLSPPNVVGFLFVLISFEQPALEILIGK